MDKMVNGDYISRYPIPKQILLIVDILLFSLLYFYAAIWISAFFNESIFSPLDRGQDSSTVFLKTIGEVSLTIGAIYLLIHFLPKVPSIVYDAPQEHMYFRTRGGDVLLAFALVACQLTFLDKLRYLYNENKDDAQQIAERIGENFILCNDGGIAPPGEFQCS